jgi:hypothetical protein
VKLPLDTILSSPSLSIYEKIDLIPPPPIGHIHFCLVSFTSFNCYINSNSKKERKPLWEEIGQLSQLWPVSYSRSLCFSIMLRTRNRGKVSKCCSSAAIPGRYLHAKSKRQIMSCERESSSSKYNYLLAVTCPWEELSVQFIKTRKRTLPKKVV